MTYSEADSIRIIPMSSNIIKTEAEAYQLFMLEVKSTSHYNYIKNQVSFKMGDSNALLLFQWHNHLIASAMMVGHDIPTKDGYNGSYVISPDSIRYFNNPISLDEIYAIDEKINRFDQFTRICSPECTEDIINLLAER